VNVCKPNVLIATLSGLLLSLPTARAHDHDPDSPAAAVDHLDVGNRLLARGDAKGAEAAFRDGLAKEAKKKTLE
jgi:hypothetical protein